MATRRRFLSLFSSRRDLVYDFHCDPCQFENTSSEGVSFCTVCNEYLCSTCLGVHRKIKIGRNHKTISVAELQDSQNESPAPLEFEYCKEHPRKLVGFYCNVHDEVFCEACRETVHRPCKEVSSIQDVCVDVKESPDIHHCMERLEFLHNRLQDVRQNSTDDLTTLQEQRANCLQKITAFRTEINQLLDLLETEVRQETESLVSKEAREIHEHISRLDAVQASLDRDQKNIDTQHNHGTDHQLFTAMKKLHLNEIEEAINKVEKLQRTVCVDFIAYRKLETFVRNLESLGHLTVKHVQPVPNTLPSTLRDRKLVEIGEQHVDEPDEGFLCNITGSMFLASGECVLCDFPNQKIKLLNQDLVLRTSVTLESRPFDVALVMTQEAVVSLPDRKQVQYVTVPGLALGQTVDVGRMCWGLAVHDGLILVSCHDDDGEGEVLILTELGEVQRWIGRTVEGSYMFAGPSYLAVDHVQERVYVSDWKEQYIHCLDIKHGRTQFTFVDTDLEQPRKMVLDRMGNAYVCDVDSHSIYVVTPDGRKYIDLLPKDACTEYPWSVCYRSRDRTLVVGMWDYNNVQVFRFV